MELIKVVHLFVVFATLTPTETITLEYPRNTSFIVDFETNQFLLDGKPFRYISGSFHYFRSQKQYWRDILKKMRAAGLNAVSTYVEWSTHEPEPGKWIWNGDANIFEFLEIAKEEDLLVILRPGPYICAERDFGGLPTWLLNVTSDINLRTNDPWFMKHAETYLDTVLSKIKPFLRGNGGPIIMIQVENEYGSFQACDIQYKNTLKNIFERHVKSNALLFTTDGPQESMLRCGVIPGVYATVDFGPSSNVTESFRTMRKFQSKGPLVNSEFYPGWLTHWGENLQTVSTLKVVKTLDEILSTGASVNIYMFFGGTNFGFKSGANTDPQFRPQLTSYDYDAPLTEAGDLTPKYFAMRDVIKSYQMLPDSPIPTSKKKCAYGAIVLEPVMNLLDPYARFLFSSIVSRVNTTPTFEELHVLPLQLVLYETYLPTNYKPSALLEGVVHDQAYVYLNTQLIGTLCRCNGKFNLSITQPIGTYLSLLVENQGHINYGKDIKDYKGLWNVTLDKKKILSWNVTGFTLESVAPLQNVNSSISIPAFNNMGPIFYRAIFHIKEPPFDTYLDTSRWGKGVAYINGYNIGRYWPKIGPQRTLYVPGVILKLGANEIILLEYECSPKSQRIKFLKHTKFEGIQFAENYNVTDNTSSNWNCDKNHFL